MRIKVNIVNSFIDGEIGGNPAGVVIDADILTSNQKMEVAKQVGLSETAFVSSSTVADFKLDFYTPVRQIPHCGHATIAAFSYLNEMGRINKAKTSKETIDGNRDIYIQDSQVFMEQLAPKYFTIDEGRITLEEIFSSLNLKKSEIDFDDAVVPIIANTGNSFLIFPFKDVDAVSKLRPNFKIIADISERAGLIGYYVFTNETAMTGRDASTRMFAPSYGIEEESATGMAAGPLACYLHDFLGLKKDEFLIEQGHLMNPKSPSVITARCQIEDAKIKSLIVGGKAKISKTLEIDVGSQT